MTVLTPEMVAKRWMCSANTVRSMVASGKLRHFRLGGKLIRIPLEAVEELEQCKDDVDVKSEKLKTQNESKADLALMRVIIRPKPK